MMSAIPDNTVISPQPTNPPTSARSTPALNVTQFAPPGADNSSSEEAEGPGPSTGLLEGDTNRGSDSDKPTYMRLSQDTLRARPSSRAGVSPMGMNRHARKYSQEQDGPHYPPGRGTRPRFRDSWDSDYFEGGPRDYAAMRDYERYLRGEPRSDRYQPRRAPYPPPSYLNNRGRHVSWHDSDEENYGTDDSRMPREREQQHQEPPRMRRQFTDEEMGLGVGPGRLARRPTSELFGKLEWSNLSRQEKKEVMRLPLTQWMNSEFKNHFVASLSEFIGTTMFLLFAFAGTEVANIQSNANSEKTTTGEATGFDITVLLYISVSFGFSLMVNAWIFFRISGGLFNPAVTLAMVMVKGITVIRGIYLFISQMLGSLLASVIVRYLFPESFNMRTTLGGSTSLVQGVFIEALLTSELVFAIFMLAKEKHRATFIAPVGIGMALFIAEMAGVQFTGGSLNPARSFGPCVIAGTFDTEHWIYWVGPCIGSLLAVVFYRFIKTLEYEMANPGADGDDLNDPTKNPEKRAEIAMANSSVKTPSILT